MKRRKLIEVALPLEVINRESAREKSIRSGHPSTLHLWWARRPLAAARAVLFAQLVDDPSGRPDEFPTDELQRKERDRLHKIIERLVVWENTRDSALLAEAHAEILKSTDGNPPPILDPFAGGGTIPLEAIRLGLEAHASDINPVAVLINKALIVIPPEFRGQRPVFRGLADSEIRSWNGAEGLAADVLSYGAWVRDEVRKRLGHLYPSVDGATPIAWIWARTITCPNPACEAEIPLISSLDLSKKKGRETWLKPVVDSGKATFRLATGPRSSNSNKSGQGAKFSCWVCGGAASPDQVHSQLDVIVKPPQRLLCVVSAGVRRRNYSEPTPEDIAAAEAAKSLAAKIRREDLTLNAECRGTFGGNAQGRRYGFFTFADYFTDRQLVTLAAFSDLVPEVHKQVRADGGSPKYADAVATYLGMVPSALSNLSSSLTSWREQAESPRTTFARQAIPMVWDFVESDPFDKAQGAIDRIAQAIRSLPMGVGFAEQADAVSAVRSGWLISTDPPYYDNIVYSDLSDYFYVWLRRSLKAIHPELLSTMLVPKAEELVANPYRLGSREKAKQFFEDGFREVFSHARQVANPEIPITVYYAFKQSEVDAEGQASSGWETLLEGMIRSGWEITSTWPVRTEGTGRMTSVGTNALASSIVLSLRPRSVDAPTTDRRGFIAALEAELPASLRKLQQGQIAPVDLPQSAIGPGMAVFSRYSAVLEHNGHPMSVRSALTRINETLDRVLNEQEGDFDSTSRFAIAWYRQHGYGVGKFGDADNLARARNTSVDQMSRDGVLTSRAGNVQLISAENLSSEYDPATDLHISNWEALHYLIKKLECDGIAAAGDSLRVAVGRADGLVDADLVKELAHLLFRVAESHGSTKDALSFNNLVTSWPEILDAARPGTGEGVSVQGALDFREAD